MKASIFPVALALTGCSESAPAVCDDRPPRFDAPVVVAEMPHATGLPRTALADDRSMIAWAESDAPGASTLHARCLAPDGAAAGDVTVPLAGQIAALELARLGGGYHAVYGTWAAAHGDDPVSHAAIDLDCDGTVSAPRAIGTPAPNAAVTALVAVNDGTAFLISTPDVVMLWIERAGAATQRVVAAPAVGATLAAGDDELAVISLATSGAAVTTFDLDANRRLDAVAVPGLAGIYDGRGCWDGAGWSLALHTRKLGHGEIWYSRVDAAGVARSTPVLISDGSGQSYDPAIACGGDGLVAIVFRRNAAGQVPGTDLVTATIDVIELEPTGGTVVHGPVELEPPAERLSMFPTAFTGSRLITTWTAFDADGYEQRFAATGDRCLEPSDPR